MLEVHRGSLKKQTMYSPSNVVGTITESVAESVNTYMWVFMLVHTLIKRIKILKNRYGGRRVESDRLEMIFQQATYTYTLVDHSQTK